MIEQFVLTLMCVLIFLAGFIVLVGLGILWEPFELDDYMERFISPHVDAAREAGIGWDRIDILFRESLEESNAWLHPGMIFRDKISREIRGRGHHAE